MCSVCGAAIEILTVPIPPPTSRGERMQIYLLHIWHRSRQRTMGKTRIQVFTHRTGLPRREFERFFPVVKLQDVAVPRGTGLSMSLLILK